MNKPLVSIITVAYNSGETIEDTIESVINQSYDNIEYLVLDGESSDNTVQILEKYEANLSYWHSKKDNGMYDALNKAIEIAKGEIIAILNSDDVYSNNQVIEKVVDSFLTSNSDAVYGDLNYVKREDLNEVVRKWKSGRFNENAFLYGWMPPHPSFFIKRICYEKFGKFNTSLSSAADYELMLRMIHVHRIKLSYIPEVLVLMRDGGLSNVGIWNRIRGNKEDRKAWRINQIKPKWFTLYLKPLRKIKQFV